MTASSSTKLDNKFIVRKLNELNIEQCAKDCGFYLGNIKKITMTNLLLSFISMSFTGKNTYSKWAEYLHDIINTTVSKVAIWKRMNKAQVECLRCILENTFHAEFRDNYLRSYKDRILFSPFKEVYIQDSTIISLPDVLSPLYKGSVSKGKQKSSLRIQAVYGFLQGGFKIFELGNFTDNDQGASGNILKIIKPGDLVIRDLGYFSLNVFKKIASIGAYFISRYRYGVKLYNKETGKEINLLKILNNNVVDIDVLLGLNARLSCRLIAVKLPDDIAAERRRKAKQDKDKRKNHSKEYMELLGWSIFITDVKRDVWSYIEITKAYRLRWHIEIIFKSWKSHFNMVQLVPESPKQNRNTHEYIERYKHRIDSIIYMMLIFIVLFHIHIYSYFLFRILEKYQKQISLLKLCSYVSDHSDKIFKCTNVDEFEVEIAYYATYEERKKRYNHFELLLNQDEYLYF